MSKLDIIRKIAESTGKSSDEIADALRKMGMMAADTGEEVSEAAVMKNLAKESGDIAQPLGSGANLDALMQAKEAAPSMMNKADDLMQQAKNAPFVDTERGISLPVSAVDDLPPANYGLGTPKAPDFMSKAPELPTPPMSAPSAPMPSQLATTADALKGSVDDALNPGMSNKTKLGLGALGVGTGAAMLGGGDEAPPMMTPPSSPAMPMSMAPSAPEAPVAPIPSPAAPTSSLGDRSAVQQAMAAFEKNKPIEPAAPIEPEIDEMQQAQDRAERNALIAMLGKSASQIGAGFAGLGAGRAVSADTSGFDELLKRADHPVSALQERKKFEKVKSELKDDKAKRDPNSEVSKLMSEVAAKAGLIKPGQVMSAHALENSGVNLGNLLSTIEAGKSRKEAAEIARQNRIADKQTQNEFKADQEKLKRDDKRKLITEEVEDRKRNIMENLVTAKQMVKDKGTVELFGSHNENLNRVIDAMAVDMAKLADPKSVARPSEVEMFKKGLFEAGLSEGNKLSNKSALDIMDKFEKEVERRAANAYKVRGITPDNSPTPGSIAPSKESSGSESNTRTFKKSYAPGSVITTKTGKFKIGSDGVTGTEIK